jgi:arylsulfatase A-like enzyme
MMMMERENWSGMFVSLGGIDKAGHMWGADHDVQTPPGSEDYQTHVEAAAKIADEELGHMLQKLEDLGQLDETLIVLTADHGATHGGQYYGKTAQGSATSNTNWYYGSFVNDVPYLDPSPALKPLIDTGNVQFSYQSTGIETWLTDNSRSKKREAARVMKTLPGVIASYYREGDHFELVGTNPMTQSERRWWRAQGQRILDTMAAPNGPDVVGLLHDNVSYGAYGDHGGHQQEVQEVPMVFWAEGLQFRNRTDATFRTTDVLPTILRTMGIRLTHPVDGRPRDLDG